MTDQRKDGAASQQSQDLEVTQRALYILDYDLRETGDQVGFDPYNSVLAHAGEPRSEGPVR